MGYVTHKKKKYNSAKENKTANMKLKVPNFVADQAALDKWATCPIQLNNHV